MEDYEINNNTLAIIPIDKNTSKVYEIDETFIVDKSVNEIMEESCQYFGSSLEGRQKGTSKLIGVTHKAPIIIEETQELIFFPTTSPRLEKCSWISLKNYENHYKSKKNSKIIVEFKRNRKLEFNVSSGIIENQILRSTRLESVLRRRKNKRH